MTTSPARSNPSASTMLRASLSSTSWPRRSELDLHRGRDGDAQLAAAGEDVDGAVLVAGQEHAVPARRLRQPVDLLLEGDDLGACLLERGDEPFVVLRQPGQLGLGRGDALLQLPDVPRALGQLAPHQGEFLLKERDLRGEIVGLPFPACGSCVRVLTACHVPPPRGCCVRRRRSRVTSASSRLVLVTTLTVHGRRFPLPDAPVTRSLSAPGVRWTPATKGCAEQCRSGARSGWTSTSAPGTASACSTPRKCSSSTLTGWRT